VCGEWIYTAFVASPYSYVLIRPSATPLQNEDEAAKMEVKQEKAKEIEKSTIKAKSKMTKVREDEFL
jgi:hypothetical protein